MQEKIRNNGKNIIPVMLAGLAKMAQSNTMPR